MREEVISSSAAAGVARSATSPPTPAASSAGASSAVRGNISCVDWFGSAQVSKAKAGSLPFMRSPLQAALSNDFCGTTNDSTRPSCRPWERGDLLRRLGTYEPSMWYGKPKEASSLACAQRGWVNIETNKIECETCGAQLTFVPSSTWTSDEVDNAGNVFKEQLDIGHDATCMWRGNCCADSLVQFPATPPSALIGGYKDRCDGLMQFDSLPIVGSSAIEKMKLSMGAQIERLLSQLNSISSGELGFRVDETGGMDCNSDDSLRIYYNAQKLISLCGWEPRWLPDVQDFEEHSIQSARNACSFGPIENEFCRSRKYIPCKNDFSASAIKGPGKKGSVNESKCNMRSPLLDCSLCGAVVRIWEFITIHRPERFGPNNIDAPQNSKKLSLTRGVSAASGINGWVSTDATVKEQMEGRDEAATVDEGKSLSNAGVDLNLTMAGGLPSTQSDIPVNSEHFYNAGMGRDLMIGQPSGSGVGDRAASFESRGPSTRKRAVEEGGSTIDRSQDRLQQADSIEGTVIDRDADETDDVIECSDGLSKRARGLDIFDAYRSSGEVDSSGAGRSRNMRFDIEMNINRVESFKEASDVAVGMHSVKDSFRASSVVAMDTVCHGADEDSMDSVENNPGDSDDEHFPSSSTGKNLDINEAPEFNYSNQAQQSICFQPAAGSPGREIGGSSINEGEEVLNAETASAQARDRVSIGLSGGSVGMGASHEAEIHGVDASVRRGDSGVGDQEPIVEVIENLGQTGESVPGPGVMDEFVPEEMDRDDANGDSQDILSHSVGRADSGSKVYGSTKADSVESGQKICHKLGPDGSVHQSLSCNAVICSGYEASKEEVTQLRKASIPILELDYMLASGGDHQGQIRYFDPIKFHNKFCPWVNGNVAAAGSSGNDACSSSSSVAHCGWQLTLDALDAFQSLGHIPNQTMQSESAASLYKDEHLTSSRKLLVQHSITRSQGQL